MNIPNMILFELFFFLEPWLTWFHLLQLEATQEQPFVENQEKHRGEAYKYWIWTRLDWHWLAPPPSIDIFLEANPRAVWIPDGSDWDGINDSPLVSWFHTSWWTNFEPPLRCRKPIGSYRQALSCRIISSNSSSGRLPQEDDGITHG